MPDLSDTSTEDPEAQHDGTASAEGQIYDYITNEPVRDTLFERVLQAVARSLAEEYDFDHTQLQRDQRIAYEVFDERGKTIGGFA
jgi:type I restriction enzyme M protein